MKDDVFVAIDVETNGAIPGINALLSLGAEAYTNDGRAIDFFQMNIKQPFGTLPDKSTMDFWANNQTAYKLATADQQDVQMVMYAFSDFLTRMKEYGKPVFLAYPTAFDTMWVYWYLVRYTGESPIGFASVDMRSYFMGQRHLRPFSKTGKDWMPKSHMLHQHDSLGDAREQADIFFSMRRNS